MPCVSRGIGLGRDRRELSCMLMFQDTGETQILLLVLWESLRFEQEKNIYKKACYIGVDTDHICVHSCL